MLGFCEDCNELSESRDFLDQLSSYHFFTKYIVPWSQSESLLE